MTAVELEGAVAEVAAGLGRLTKACHALSCFTRPAAPAVVSEQTEKELHVFCNPLFGAT